MDTIFASTASSVAPAWEELERTDSGARLCEFVRPRGGRTGRWSEPSTWSLSPWKRCLDFALAVLGLLLASPLLLIAAFLVRFRSPGPIIFRQRRVGRGGELFTVYKFRTMEFHPEDAGLSMTKRGDPRVTPFGRFLRYYKLDELPQLINVLRGEMSMVGPRPRLARHMNGFDLPYRPGLTGAATIAFCNEEELLQHIPDQKLEEYNLRRIIPLKTRLDWNYMARATLLSDVVLLFRTAVCCVSRRCGAIKLDPPYA